MKWSPFNCQSLLGYAGEIHQQTRGVCAYCDYGKNDLSFNMWRQLTLEHVIPDTIVNGKEVRSKLMELFGFSKDEWPTRRDMVKCCV